MDNIFVFNALQEQELYFTIIKDFFSMVLLALCDANYCFTLIDIGRYGSNNDSGVLAQSFFNSFPGGFFPIPLLSLRHGYLRTSSDKRWSFSKLHLLVFPMLVRNCISFFCKDVCALSFSPK